MAEKTREAVVPWIAAGSPLKRACRPEEVAQTIYWLSSAEASFINGIALVMDGGITGGRLWSQSQAEGGMLVELLYKAAAQ
jgi:NAD(P)-dependent dehydrogenase (short-subunit alcohol dehydrogenase family)